MKKLIISTLATLLLGAGLASAQVQTNYWKLQGTTLSPSVASWTVNTGSGGATSTFGFITATTTTATSTFAGDVYITGNLRVTGNFFAPVSISAASHIRPSADNTYDLGSSTSRWANIYGVNVFATSSILTNATSTTFFTTTGSSTNFRITNASTTAITLGTAYTGFTTGSVTFANGSGILAQANSNLFYDSTNFRLGINTATPGISLDVATGTIAAREYNWSTATSTTMSIDWKRANTQKVLISTAAVTITHVNATTTLGAKITLIVCNSGSVAGAITWGNPIYWAGGTAPTQTTTANKCDVWSFMSTSATSTNVIFGSATSGF